MIPLRLELTGWLTYREPVVFDFSGHWIWAITGENGAGKSAIFDAITYALYGEHRGGAQRDERVVSQGLDLARVVFDFAIGGQAYRIERTLSVRTRSRRVRTGAVPPVEVDKAANAYRLDPRPDGGEAIPVPITGTESIRELEQWVQRTVGFGFSTFTSSVLLRQGEADRLVMAKPADRKKIFLELLDLQRYQQVEALARKRQQRHAHDLMGLGHELQIVSDASAEAVAEAQAQFQQQEELAREAQVAFDAATRLWGQAETYTRHVDELANVEATIGAADALLADADAIEREYAELARLDEALPILTALLEHRERADSATTDVAILLVQIDAIDLAVHEATILESQAKLERAEIDLTAANEALAACDSERETLRPRAEAGRKLQDLDVEIATVDRELAALGGKLAGREAAEGRRRACDEADRAFQPVQMLRPLRQKVALTSRQLRAAELRLPDQREEVDTLIRQFGETQQGAQSARERVGACRLALALAEAERQRCAGELQSRREATGEATCQRCGQPIDPVRLAEEIADGERTLAALTGAVEGRGQDVREAEAEEERFAAASADLETRLGEARERLRLVEDECRRYPELLAEALQAVAKAQAALPPAYAALAADEAYPTADQIAAVKALAQQLPEEEETCRRLAALATRAELLEEQQRQRQISIAALTAMEERAALLLAVARETALREARPGLVEETVRQQGQVQASRIARGVAQCALDTAREERGELLTRRGTRQREADIARALADALCNQLGAAWSVVCAGLDTGRLTVLRERATGLGAAAKRKADLDKQREEQVARRERATFLREAIDAIPAEARITPGEADARRRVAVEERDRCDREAMAAAQAAAVLVERCQRRTDLLARQEVAVRRRDDYARLTQLLGKQGLQSWLVQEAQEAIGQGANEFLTRLSNGALALTLEPRGEELEMLVSDFGSGQAPLDVRFISGSQRFRVAVALALAIGQYAGEGARAIRAVVIDEGFGSLDSDGRRDMIALLHGLEGVLDRVLLVSHQEEFQDAFPHGYHIEKTSNGSRASRRVPVADLPVAAL